MMDGVPWDCMSRHSEWITFSRLYEADVSRDSASSFMSSTRAFRAWNVVIPLEKKPTMHVERTDRPRTRHPSTVW